MTKKILLIMLALFLSQCGYEKIYSSKNINLSINKIKKENNIINNELSNALLEILSDKTSDNIYDLEIQNKKFKEIKSKDSKGDPLVYVLKLETKIIATSKGKEYENIILKEMNYNNNDDKFELSQYIGEIEKILIKETVQEIINYLTDVR